MNLARLNGSLNPYRHGENSLLAGVHDILNACERSENLMTGIYGLEQDCFLYIGHPWQRLIGESRPTSLWEGWDFWYALIDPSEVTGIKDNITAFFASRGSKTSLTLYYHILDHQGHKVFLRHELILHQIRRRTLAINYLFDVSDKERIEICFKEKDQMGRTTPSSEELIKISSREKEILKLIADGFSSKEIAHKLFISNHTAISHRKNLIRKFKARNTAHLIKQAAEFIPI